MKRNSDHFRPNRTFAFYHFNSDVVGCLISVILFSSIIECFALDQSIPDLRESELSSSDISLFSNEINSGLKTHNQFVSWAAVGQTFALTRRYVESNKWFEKAYLLKMDERNSSENKKEESYEELYEVSMVLYFKALNYLEMGDIENAMVECRRMDEWMRPRQHDDLDRRMLSEDPLIHTLMGIIFEMDNDYSDSYLSYSKARELFETDYKDLFSKHVPRQIIRSQLEMDSMAEVSERAVICRAKAHYGKLIFLWNNGQGPQKKIAGEDFKIKSVDGFWYTTVANGITLNDGVGNTLLPFYKFTSSIYSAPVLLEGDRKIKCELLEDIDWHSVWTLQEQLHSNGIHVWRHGINWSTLPASIYYAEVPLDAGINKFDFMVHGKNGTSIIESFTIVGDGKIHCHTITTLASEFNTAPNTNPINVLPEFYQMIKN